MQEVTATVRNGLTRRLTGWFARLVRDQKGNTLAMVGAALVPLAAMIGSGVDMSRAYMAKHRLQAACDAAALAGRQGDGERHSVHHGHQRGDQILQLQFPSGHLRHPDVHAVGDQAVERRRPGDGEHPDADRDHEDVRIHDSSARCDLRRFAQLREHRRRARPRHHRIDARRRQRQLDHGRSGPKDHRSQGRGDGPL